MTRSEWHSMLPKRKNGEFFRLVFASCVSGIAHSKHVELVLRAFWVVVGVDDVDENGEKPKQNRKRRKKQNQNYKITKNGHFIPILTMKLNTCAPAILCSLFSLWFWVSEIRNSKPEKHLTTWNKRERKRMRAKETHKENYRSANLGQRFFHALAHTHTHHMHATTQDA